MNNDDIDKRRIHLFITLITSIFLLSSCSKDSKSKFSNNNCSCINPTPESALLISQKYDDIPLPIGFKSIPKRSVLDHKNNSLMTSYVGNLTISKTSNFYKQMMEMNGWAVQDFSTNKEGLLICNKSNKKSAISIRENYDKRKRANTSLVLFVQNKSEEDNCEEDKINEKKL